MATWTNVGGDNLWSNPDNWYPGLPVDGDAVRFNDTSVADCIMDIDCNVCNLWMAPNYTGHLDASIYNITAEVGDCIIEGNQWSLGDGDWEIGRHFDYASLTTLNANNSTVTMIGAAATICGKLGNTLNNFVVPSTASVAMSDGTGFIPKASSTIECSGDVTISGLFTSVGVDLMVHNGSLYLPSGGEITGDYLTIYDSNINSLVGQITTVDFEWRDGQSGNDFAPGTINAATSTIWQLGNNSYAILDGSYIFTGDLRIDNADASAYNIRLRVDTNVQVQGDLIFVSPNINLINNTNSKFTLTGTGPQNVWTQGITLLELVVDKSGTATLNTDLDTSALTLVNGNLDAVAAVNNVVADTFDAQATFGTLDFSTADCDVTVHDLTLACDTVYLGDGTCTILASSWTSGSVNTWVPGASTVQVSADCTIETGSNPLNGLTIDVGTVVSIPGIMRMNGTLLLNGTLDVSGYVGMNSASEIQIPATGVLVGPGQVASDGWTAGAGVTQLDGILDVRQFFVYNATATAALVPGRYRSEFNAFIHNVPTPTGWRPQVGSYIFYGDVVMTSSGSSTMTIENNNNPNMTFNGDLQVSENSPATTVWNSGNGNYLIHGDVFLACDSFNAGTGTWEVEGNFDYSQVTTFTVSNANWEFNGTTILTGTNTGALRNVEVKDNKSVTISASSVGGGVSTDTSSGTITINGTMNVPLGTFFEFGGSADLYLPTSGVITGNGTLKVNDSTSTHGIQQLDGDLSTQYFDYQGSQATDSVFASGTIGSSVSKFHNQLVADTHVVWNDIEFLGRLELHRLVGMGDLDVDDTVNNPDITLWSHVYVYHSAGNTVTWNPGTGCIYYVGGGQQNINWEGLTVESCIVIDKTGGGLVIDGEIFWPPQSGLMIVFEVNLYPNEECLGALTNLDCSDLIDMNPNNPEDQKSLWLFSNRGRYMEHGERFTAYGAEAAYLQANYTADGYPLRIISVTS